MSKQSKLCEACSQPISEDAVPVRVGACEFPFYVHEHCKQSMEPVAGFVEELCELAEHQPDGLLWLGSWSSDAAKENVMDKDEFLRAYIAGETADDGGSLSVQEDALYVDGWWPAGVRLGDQTHLVRTDPDGPEQELGQALIQALQSAGLRRIESDWSLLEAVTLQRLGLMGATWEVWGSSEAAARLDVEEAASGQTAPSSGRTLEDVAIHQEITRRGADRLRKAEVQP